MNHKYFITLLILSLIIPLYSYPQLSIGGKPESFTISTLKNSILPYKFFKMPDIDSLMEEDKQKGIENRTGIIIDVEIDLIREGLKEEIPTKGYIWRYKIISDKAKAIATFFKEYYIPQGGKLFLYDASYKKILGAFTNLNNNSRNNLAIASIESNVIILEYFQPYNTIDSLKLKIGWISLKYKTISDYLKTTQNNIIYINCPQGSKWQNEKHAVCYMEFKIDKSYYLCTGFLINNVREDGEPYYMTANHCIDNEEAANSAVVYFNYENSTCESSDALKNQTLSGATLKATSIYTDFTLLLLTEKPPVYYFPYYVGWDVTGRRPYSAVGIHHPGGKPKAISIENDRPRSYPYKLYWESSNYYSEENTHWQVVFDEGITEGGSSGSPLLDEYGRAIGQLHGGPTTNPSIAYYGKISLSWNYDPAPSKQLKYWLDPDNTGKTVLNGRYFIKPEANFYTKLNQVCINSPVTLFDSSLYNPTNWLWSINPSTYSFIENTNQNSQNPIIVFHDTGYYTISLYVSNEYGNDTKVKENYIKVNNYINITAENLPDSYFCACDLKNYKIILKGADTYDINLNNTERLSYILKSDTLFLNFNKEYKNFGDFYIDLSIVGNFGTCSDTVSKNIKVIVPPNDDIDQAIYLHGGSKVIYSNFCASTEDNEPCPPMINCYGYKSWCYDPNGINKSIWFKFLGPSSGKITINSSGIDTRIAIYQAEKVEDLKNGNYLLVAANDNISPTNKNSSLSNIDVVPGKNYFLQIDGFKGDYGNIQVELLTESVEIYQNPTTGIINLIISDFEEGIAKIDLYNISGQLIFTQNLDVKFNNNLYTFNLNDLNNGLYILKITINDKVYNKKIIIKR